MFPSHQHSQQTSKLVTTVGTVSALTFALTTVILLGAKPAVAQETTVALCQTPTQTIRIYQNAGQTYMRAYNRQDQVVWMNQTPVSTEANPEGKLYKNLRGEGTVSLFAYSNGESCSIQIGSGASQQGRLIQ